MSNFATSQAREPLSASSENYTHTTTRGTMASAPDQTDSSSTLTVTDAERTVRGSLLDPEAYVDVDGDVERGGLDQPMERGSKEKGILTHPKDVYEKGHKDVKVVGEVDPNECRFEGDDDPDDPLNLPALKKWLAVFVVGTGAICV